MNFIRYVLSGFLVLGFFSIVSPTPSNAQDKDIIIRQARSDDFEVIKALGVKTFAHAYNYTTQEQRALLAGAFTSVWFDEEIDCAGGHKNNVALVAMCENNIIGFVSARQTEAPNEIYGSCLMVDPDFQSLGVARKLLVHCYELFLGIKRVVCLTRKTNTVASKFYERFGGKRVEEPSWKHYLYKAFNALDFVGYEFDEQALTTFLKKMQPSSVTLQWIEALTTNPSNEELRKLYMSAFKEVYKEHLTDAFLKTLENNYDLDLQDFKNAETPMFLCLAHKQQELAGFALFRKVNDREVVLELICVKPECWSCGIGRDLVFSIKERLNNINKIKVSTYKINPRSSKFYEKLGFRKTEHFHEHYNPDDTYSFECWV